MTRQPEWDDSRSTTNLSRRKGRIALIVLHHTAGTRAGDLPILLGQTSRRVSADFYITRSGRVYKLNPQLTEFYTWHAGVSSWRGRNNCNPFSLGIEMEHRVGEGWPEAQVSACAHLAAWLVERYDLDLRDGCIQSHRAIAPTRKTDPESFHWTEFSSLVRRHLGV